MPMDNKKVSFLPYHAINEFMRPDYRQNVITSVYHVLTNLPDNQRSAVNHLVKQIVKVPGFRNSTLAPTPLKIKPTINAFEKDPVVVAIFLSAWAESKSDLRQEVYDLLVERKWELLPPAADRTKLPGFLPKWPEGENFDLINQAYTEKYPDHPVNTDDVSLMVVWLGGRLPYEQESDDQADNSEQATE